MKLIKQPKIKNNATKKYKKNIKKNIKDVLKMYDIINQYYK